MSLDLRRADPPRQADLVIIGGGVVGAATAFFAARAGLRPLLLERRPALATLTTAAATGSFRLQFDNPEELALVRESVDLYLNFTEVTGQREYDPAARQQGYLWVTCDDATAAWQRELVARQHGWGLDDVEILSGDEARRRFPYLAPAVIQARFRAGDGLLDQKRAALGLAAASGATIVTGCGATGFQLAGGRLTAVETTAGPIATDTAIIAAGPFAGPLAATAGLTLPLTNIRRQKVILPELPQAPPGAPMTIDDDIGTHWRPALRGAYLLGADPDTPPGPPLEDVLPDADLALRLLDPASPLAAARSAPFWAAVWTHGGAHWSIQAGQYTMTPDSRPLIGPATIPGLWLNAGYGGHGVMASPGGSHLLLDLLTGRRNPADNPFRPDRPFTAPAGRAL
ncbi:MAG: NAD(P)/FAD-dependent oxidoreductase [Thermomicrobiales bacterium]